MKKSNRFYSSRQEKKVAKSIGGKQTKNSGAGMFDKGDVKDDDILIECKTLVKPQKQHAIKKEWIEKNQAEAFSRGKELSALAFDFGDEQENYYILREIDFKLMLEAYRNQRDS